jgi:hypothetical protein
MYFDMEGSKMKKSLLLSGILSLILVIALLAGCAFEQPASDEEAIVEVTIVQDMFSTKTIEPGISMDITEYLLKWDTSTTPAANTKTIFPTGGATTVFLLLSPDVTYYFQIEGYNLDGDKIGESIVVPKSFYPGSRGQQSVELKIVPVDGQGNFSISVDWSTAAVDLDAALTAHIFSFDADVSGTPAQSIVGTAGNPSATVSGSLDDGYYKCVIELKDQDTDNPNPVLWSTLEALRIVTGYDSTESYDLIDGQLDALVAVEVSEDMPDNPLDIALYIDVLGDVDNGVVYQADDVLPSYFTIDKTDKQILVVQARPIDRSTKERTSVESFDWYINGTTNVNSEVTSEETVDPATTQSTIQTDPANRNPGLYTLSVMITKNGALSSRSVQFIIAE